MSYTILCFHICHFKNCSEKVEGGRDCMVVEFTTTCTIGAYYLDCKFELRAWRGKLDTTLCDKVCQ